MSNQENVNQELAYIRGRVDAIYDTLNSENQRITQVETKLNCHTYDHWKNFTVIVVIISALIGVAVETIFTP